MAEEDGHLTRLGIVEEPRSTSKVCPGLRKRFPYLERAMWMSVAEELDIPILGRCRLMRCSQSLWRNERFSEVSNEYLAAAVNKF
ncbi:MAG: hypothetical protein ACLTLQ_08980 [[Clostridium] scindens]